MNEEYDWEQIEQENALWPWLDDDCMSDEIGERLWEEQNENLE
jgi:hypothetical protein